MSELEFAMRDLITAARGTLAEILRAPSHYTEHDLAWFRRGPRGL